MNISRLSIVKIVELIIVFVLLGLHYNAGGSTVGGMLTMTAYGGYFVILIGLFAGALMGTPVNRRVDLYFSVVAVALFVTVGAMAINDYSGERRTETNNSTINRGLAKGVISLLEGGLFLFDAFLTFRGES